MEELKVMFEAYPWVSYTVSGLASAIILATVIIKLTPNKKDDLYLEKEWVQKVLGFIEKFSLIKLK